MIPPTNPNDETRAHSHTPPRDTSQASFDIAQGVVSSNPKKQFSASRSELAGTVIAGKYTLAEVVGEGGMGSVWRAKQTSPVKRLVAVKLIKAGMDSKQVLARFDAERQALALMDHPNIAKVLDGGLHESRPFFVMELVNGIPITDYCDRRKLNPRARLELFVQVCQAIQHAHHKGIIHRDIKPSNVLIALYDDKPVVKVIDFGVAKATGGALTESTLDTGFGGVVGTPQYMSPEQATFDNLDIDTRSDIYALGVLMYELLTGSTPFAKKELEKKGLLEMLRVVREEEPPRPSTKLSVANTLHSLSANRSTEPKILTGMLRKELDWIVMKSLEKDRSRRYETANGFAADVMRYLNGEAVQAHPPSTAYRFKKFVRRNQGQVIAGSLLLFALLAGMAGTTFGLIRAEQQRQLAEENERKSALAASAERQAKVEAELKREEAIQQRERAETNERKAAAAERRATEEATSAQLLAHFVNAQFMLSQGRVGPAFEAIQNAIRIRPRWEYGNLLADIVGSARRNWRPVASFKLDTKSPIAATFVGPSNQHLAVVNGARLHLFDVPTARLLAETELGAAATQPFRIGEEHVGIVQAKSVKIFARDNLKSPRTLTLEGEVKLAVADSLGQYVAVMLESGDTTIFDVKSLKSLAIKRFNLPTAAPGLPTDATLSFNPTGKRLLFSSGLWTQSSVFWNWEAGTQNVHRFGGGTNSAQFIDEFSIVDVSRWNAASESLVIGLTNFQVSGERTQNFVFASRAGETPVSWRGFLPDGSPRIFTASTSADSIDLFNVTDQKLIHSTRFATLLPSSPRVPKYLAFSPDCNLLAVTSEHGVVVFQGGESPALNKSATTSSAGTRFWSMANSNDHQFTGLYNIAPTNRIIQLLRKSFADNRTTTFSLLWPDAKPMASADLWGMAVTPDGKNLAALWQENSGGGNIASAYYRKAIQIYRLDSKPDAQGRLSPAKTIWLEKYQGLNGRGNRLVVLAPDGKTVAYVPGSGEATIYRVDDGTILKEFTLGQTMRHSPDGSLLIGGGFRDDQPVTVWKTQNGEQIFRSSESGKVRSFALTRDNRKLYVGWEENFLECFDLASGKSVSKIPCNSSPIAIAPQGDRFVGFLPDNSTNGSLVLGSLTDGQTVQVINPGAHILNSAVFNPAGDCLSYAKTRDTAVILRSLSIPQSIQLLEQTAPFVSTSPSLQYFQLNDQIHALAQGNATEIVLQLLPKWRRSAWQALADKEVMLADHMSTLGVQLLRLKAYVEAESLLRVSSEIRAKKELNTWPMYHTQSLLGEALLAQQKHAEAEPLLLNAYEGLKEQEKKIPPQDGYCIPQALDRLIQLATALDKSEELQKWQTERAKYPAKVTAKK